MSTINDSPGTNSNNKIIIYFLSSSSPSDIEACKTVHNHLSQFIHNSKPSIEIYSDYTIDAGVEIDSDNSLLYAADLVIAFGSSDFIADQKTYSRINKVIDRYNKRQTRLLGIIVRNFMWRDPFFGQLPLILPVVKKPLYDQKTWNIDDAFSTVAQEIRDVITKHYKIVLSTVEIRPWDDK